MDKRYKNFILPSILSVLTLLALLIVFGYVYSHFTIDTYKYILLMIILVTIIIAVLFMLSVIAVFYTYQKKRVYTAFDILLRIGLKLVIPFIIFISGVLKADRDFVRNIYIEVNNIYVRSKGKKYPPEKVLLLLPHCLQDSQCLCKVTQDIANCRGCGKCCVGEILKVSKEKGIEAAVVTGGTVARNMVSKIKPELILSVACERDLTSGIADVKGIPVIGIINERPNGPCHNTFVNADAVRKKLGEVLND